MRSVPRRLRVPGASPVMAAFWTSRVCAPWRRCIFQTKAGRRWPGSCLIISRKPSLRQVVILDGPVLHGAIVPHQEVAGTPFMAINEGRLDDVIGERSDQRLGLVPLDALDAGAVVAHDVEAFAPGIGMRPDKRMP